METSSELHLPQLHLYSQIGRQEYPEGRSALIRRFSDGVHVRSQCSTRNKYDLHLPVLHDSSSHPNDSCRIDATDMIEEVLASRWQGPIPFSDVIQRNF